MKQVPRSFYRRDARLVAPELLNKILLASDGRAGRIVETEAYCGREDAAAHSFRGPTPRSAAMFGPPGHLYVYFTYGMHWCCNAVCGEGEGHAVLIRALEPLAGLDTMRARRPRVRGDRDLCNGPGKLTQALGIGKAHDGADLVKGNRGVRIVSDGTPPPRDPAVSARVGISKAMEYPWRWFVDAHPQVSGRRR